MHNYAGNPASYPANVGLVDDADLNPATAAALVVASENLADRTAYLHANSILSTGGTMSGTLQVSGEVDFLNGSFLVLEAGSEAIVEGGASVIYASAASWILQAGAVGQIQAGAGVGVYGAGGIVALVPSAIQAQSPGGLDSLVPGGIRLSGGATDNVAFNPPRTRAVMLSLEIPPVRETGWGTYGSTGSYIGGAAAVFLAGPGTNVSQTVLLKNLHNGATLSSIELRFIVKGPHSVLPGQPPLISAARLPLTTGLVPGNIAITATQAIPLPGTALAWDDGGAVQAFSYVCGGIGAIVDTSQYLYRFTIIDENDGGTPGSSVAGNAYLGIIVHYINIADARFQ